MHLVIRPFQLTPLESSFVKGYHYDPITAALTLELASGDRYRYATVPAEVVVEFLSAESLGRFFSRSIKGQFVSEKLTGVCSEPGCGSRGMLCEQCTQCALGHYQSDRPTVGWKDVPVQ